MNKVSSPRQIKVAKVVLWFAIPAFAVAIFLNASLALGFNASQSLPQTTFIMLKFPKIIQRGSYVAFTPPKRFDRGFYFVKQVIGVEGDAVVHIGDEVCINNRCFTPTNEAPVFSALIERQIIPKGYYYVAGETNTSLDSRYAALGLIPKSAILASGIATNWLPNTERLQAWFQGETGTQLSADKSLTKFSLAERPRVSVRKGR